MNHEEDDEFIKYQQRLLDAKLVKRSDKELKVIEITDKPIEELENHEEQEEGENKEISCYSCSSHQPDYTLMERWLDEGKEPTIADENKCIETEV